MTPQEIALLYCTPRYTELDRYERVVNGTQYTGRDPFLAIAVDTPLLERAPCIVDPIVKKARDSHGDFVLGEGRWPTITSFTSEDDREFDPDYGLSEDDSKALDKSVSKIERQVRLRAAARGAMDAALDCGTAVSVCGVRDGSLFVENIRAAWCTPTFDPARPSHVSELEIKYPYLDTYYDNAEKKYVLRCMLYRRVITASRDIVYVPAVAKDDGSEPTWTENPAASVDHALGFCPVRWYACLAPSRNPSQIDGRPLHFGQLDEIEAYHFSLSQHHRASFYAGDPLLCEFGADRDDGTQAGIPGRAAYVEIASDDTSRHPQGTFVARGGSGGSRGVRRRGAHIVSQYDDPNARVELKTLPADALKAIADNADLLAQKIRGSLRHVDLDMETARSAADASGKALETLYQPQLNFANTLREDFGEGWLLPVVDMLLRIALVVGRRSGTALYLPGLPKLIAILARFEKSLTTGIKRWFSPHFDLVWGPYFRANMADQQLAVELIAKAQESGFITRELGIDKLRREGVFAIKSAEDLAATLKGPLTPANDVTPGAPGVPGAPGTVDAATGVQPSQITLTPSDQATIVRVDEARGSMSLGSFGPDGDLTIAEFKSKHSQVLAEGAAADAGQTAPTDPEKEAKVKADALAAKVAAKPPPPPPPQGAP